MRTPIFEDDQEIIDCLADLESRDFPSDECGMFTWALVNHHSGEVAEGAVRSLVDNFTEDRLSALVDEHVVPHVVAGFDYCQATDILADELGKLEFEVRTGWFISWPGGELEGDNLCRLALLAVWFRRMRAEELEG